MTEIHMADMTTIKEKIRETIYPNGTGAITAEKHQALLIDLVNDINKQKADAQALTELEEKVDSLPVGGDVKADGAYPDLIAGDLVGRGESVPAEFTFRASGGKSIKDGKAYIKRIKGNSVVWNQKLRNSRIENADYWYSQRSNAEFNGQGVHIVATSEFSNLCQNARLILGHKYLLYASVKGNNGYRLNLNLCGQDTQGEYLSDNYAPHYYFTQFNEYLSDIVQLYVIANDADWYVKDCRLIDLTQMFGAGNEPSTIEEYNARKPIVADEYAFNEGQVIHCNTESIKSVGDNAWDEQWEVGGLSEVTGQEYDTTTNFRSKNYIKILPNTQYYFKKPAGVFLLPYYYDEDKNFIATDDVMFTGQNGNAFTTLNAAYMRFIVNQGNYGNDIMLTLVHSGWKQDTDAGYQPYWQDILPLSIISKYFPDGMKLAGSAHDEIRYNKASGKWEAVQRMWGIRVADYVRRDAEGVFIMSNLPKKPATNINGIYSKNVLMVGYTPDLGAFSYGVISEARIAVVEDSIWLNAENLKQYASTQEYIDAIGDTKVFYELAEPIVTELDEADQNFRDYYNVADFGTEQSQSSVPSAPFSADIIYQFNAVDMIREHELEITELQRIVAELQSRLS